LVVQAEEPPAAEVVLAEERHEAVLEEGSEDQEGSEAEEELADPEVAVAAAAVVSQGVVSRAVASQAVASRGEDPEEDLAVVSEDVVRCSASPFCLLTALVETEIFQIGSFTGFLCASQNSVPSSSEYRGCKLENDA
jgi:hypothetical protein